MSFARLPVLLVLAACAQRAGGNEALGLAEAMRIARENSPAIASARASRDVERARYLESRAALWPRLGLRAERRDFTFNPAAQGLDVPGLDVPERLGPIEDYEAGIAARFPLFDLPAWRRAGAARSSSEAESLRVEAAGDQCAYAAASAYLASGLARKRVEIREQSLAMADSLLILARARKEAGAITGLDVTRVEIQTWVLRDALRSARADAEDALARLHAAMGVPYAKPASLSDTLADTLAPPMGESVPDGDGLRAEAMERRPELRAGEKLIAAAEEAAGAALAHRFPVIRVQGQYGYSGTDLHGLQAVRSMSVGLEWSIWDGGEVSARRAAETARRRDFEARLRQARIDIGDEVRSAGLRLRNAGESIVTAREQVRLSQREWNETFSRFREGAAAGQDLIEAQNRVIKARDGLYQSLHAYQASRLALYRAAGKLESF